MSCSGHELYLQPRYTNTSAGLTRADGYNVIANTVEAGYIRYVKITQYRTGQVGPGREVTYSGSAKQAKLVDIPTSYLPWMGNDGHLAVNIQAGTTTIPSWDCGIEVGIGQ